MLTGPLGDRRGDYNAAMLARTTVAASGAYEDPDDVPGVDDFLIRYGIDVAQDDTSALESKGNGGGYSWMQD